MFSASSPRELVLVLVLLLLLSCVFVGVFVGSAAKRAIIVIEASEETNESDDSFDPTDFGWTWKHFFSMSILVSPLVCIRLLIQELAVIQYLGSQRQWCQIK
ncbi:hypothetical protein B0H14DRAFT_3150797 [Mycena olivaceomarginata]|nr:hypothetical protein B0H14DRAFT_3150797 [Mycena olivaceomarginata]